MAMSRSLGCSSLTRPPSMAISPSVIVSSPAIMLSRVDLPQPEGPTRTKNSPSSMAMSIPLRMCSGPKCFLTLLMVREAMASPLDGAGHHAAHEVLASEDVDEQGRQGGHHGRGHVDIVFFHARRCVDDVVQRHRDRRRTAGGEGGAEQKVVPDVGELPDHGDDQDRQR